jgi:hypothetical protein
LHQRPVFLGFPPGACVLEGRELEHDEPGVRFAAGALFGDPEDPIAVIAFTITQGRIAMIDLIADPDKLSRLAF